MSIGRVPGATGIQPSIVDAKGDLIAATAADSVSRLAVGTNNQVLTADSAEATGLKYANGSRATLTTTGDLLYASAANTPARLAIGSTSQVLTVSGGIPAWATPAGGGKVLQVVSATTTTATTISSTTYTDTGLSLAITPSATSSKILVLISQFVRYSAGTDQGFRSKIVRGSTDIYTPANLGLGNFYIYNGSSNEGDLQYSYSYLDSPSTTSSTTYKTQGRANFAAQTVTFQNASNPASIILMEIGA